MATNRSIDCSPASDPQRLLRLVKSEAGDRKLRLIAIAFCRRLWHLFGEDKPKNLVLAAERYVDGLLDASHFNELSEHVDLDRRVISNAPVAWTSEEYASAAAGEVVTPDSFLAASNVCWLAQFAHDPEMKTTHMGDPVTPNDESRCQVELICDILGPLPMAPNEKRQGWITESVRSMAQHIYHHADFTLMPILADALEEAGCNDADILAHCRGPGPHVRGCWVVDLILGKK